MRILERPIRTYTPVNSQEERTRLPLGASILGYRLRFTGTLTVGVAAATILEDSPLGYLRNIQLVVGGSFPLRVHDARFVNFWNRLQYGAPNRITAPSGAVGASNFTAEVIVSLEQPDLLAALGLKRGFILDSRPLGSLELVVTPGVDADVATPGGGGTAVLSALSIQITEMAAQDVAGVLSRMQIARIQQAISATGSQDLPLMPGAGVAYRAFALHFTSGNADPIRATSDDTVLTDLTVIDSRGVRYLDAVPYEQLRAQNKRTYGLETIPAGFVVADFAQDHTLDDLLFTFGIQNVTVRMNVGAAPANTFVQAYPINALLVPARGVGPAGRGGARARRAPAFIGGVRR